MAELGPINEVALSPESNQVHARALVWIRTWADKLGICLSALCLIHCLITPMLLIFLPALSLWGHHVFHDALLVILPLLAIAAFIPGFVRHRDPRVFYWAIPGLAAVVLGTLLFEEEIILQAIITISGSILLIRAHLKNRALCACCEAGHLKR